MPKITKRFLDSLPRKQDRDLQIMDDELKRFGVRIRSKGGASFFVRYSLPDGKQRRLTLGKVGAMTPDEARRLAIQRLSEADRGQDPSGDKKERRLALSVSELCDAYLDAARSGLVFTRFGRPKRSSTIAIDVGRIERHIKPLIGHRKATSLKRVDVQLLYEQIAKGATAAKARTRARGVARVTGGTGTAARVVELIGGIWTWAEKREIVEGANPAHGIDRARSQPKDRVLSPQELRALGYAINQKKQTHPMISAAILLIAVSGLRRDEALGLRWDEIDEHSQSLRLKETKTGRSVRPLSKAALEIIKGQEKRSIYVFPRKDGKAPFSMKKPIADVFDAADLNDARAQVLRRTFASTAAELNFGDSTISELLGHSRRGVTERHYVRRPDQVVLAAANKVAETILNRLEKG